MKGGTTTRTIFAGLAMLLAAALPLSAQDVGEGQDAPTAKHAEIGTLESVGAHNDRIVLSRPADVSGETVYWSYATNYDTEILGLGGVMRVSEIPPGAIDNVALVTFANREERPLATRLYFPDEQTVRVAHGTVDRIDRQEQILVLRTPEGRTERYDLGIGPGTTVDSDQGLRSVSDLRSGEEITVYHAEREAPVSPPQVEEAFLIYEHG